MSTRVRGLLAKPLDALLVSERESRDGRTFRYIDGTTAINQANRIFGYDGWGTELVGEVGFRTLRLIEPDTEAPLAVGMYSAVVRVTVRGCAPRSDAGCGFVEADTPEAHEAAYKGAVTDALKRALRFFGDQFGNGLYDRRSFVDLRMPASGSAAPDKLGGMRRKVLALSTRIGLDAGKALARIEERCGNPLDALSEEQLSEEIRELADEYNRRNGRPVNGKQSKAA
jgi:DNA recombination protein Rad52